LRTRYVNRSRLRRIDEALAVFLSEVMALKRDRALARYTPKLERAIGSAFRGQGQEFLGELAERYRGIWISALGEFKREQPTIPGWELAWAAAASQTTDSFAFPLLDAIRFGLSVGGGHAAQDLEVQASFNLQDPLAYGYLDEHGAKLVTRINDTTKEEMRRLLAEGAREGWGYDTLAKKITSRFDDMATSKPQQHIASRAHLVAVTELGEAYQAGQDIMVQTLSRDSGLAMEKAWLTVGDGKVSDGCAENQAAGWIPLENAFPSGHMHPLRFPGCRCTALYRRAGAADVIPLPGQPAQVQPSAPSVAVPKFGSVKDAEAWPQNKGEPIPMDLLLEKQSHTKPYPGDQGIRFEPAPLPQP